MSRALGAVVLSVFATVMLSSVRCDSVSGGPPKGVRVMAVTDSTVMVLWSAPIEGTPEVYLLSFQQVNEEAFAPLGQTGDTTYVHDPQGVTGTYKVVAQFGDETYEATEKPSTVPVFTDTIPAGELNSTANSGYGWNRGSGLGGAYPMEDPLSVYEVDFYISDFDSGFAGPEYSIVTPDSGPADPGGGVVPGDWRASGFTSRLVHEDMPLPPYHQSVYERTRCIDTVPMVLGCHTEDNHYAVVRFTKSEKLLGQVRLKSWFQLVEGLRLVEH